MILLIKKNIANYTCTVHDCIIILIQLHDLTSYIEINITTTKAPPAILSSRGLVRD